MNRIILAIIAAAIAGTGVAMAAEPFLPRKERGFARLDVNKDGSIARDEFGKVAGRRFARMDVNGDKAVTAAEIDSVMQAALQRRRSRILQLMDRDADGTITQAELDKVADAMFNGADLDHNGGLSLAETQGFKRELWRRALVGEIASKGAN